jgi:hypothetical protein
LSGWKSKKSGEPFGLFFFAVHQQNEAERVSFIRNRSCRFIFGYDDSADLFAVQTSPPGLLAGLSRCLVLPPLPGLCNLAAGFDGDTGKGN